MANINQYCRELENVLKEQVGIRVTIKPIPIRQIIVTNPDYINFLIQTYGLSQAQLDSDVFRIGIGRKLSKDDSDIYNEVGDLIEKPEIDESGILCPLGILMFFEDVLYEKGGDVQILATSYHFQTAPPTDYHPLYVRFEFDPIVTTGAARDFNKKPIFHYHFSNYELAHTQCHFPAGHFELPNHYPFNTEELSLHFRPPVAPNLKSFISLLNNANLIASP
jgi:hypothetical protein